MVYLVKKTGSASHVT